MTSSPIKSLTHFESVAWDRVSEVWTFNWINDIIRILGDSTDNVVNFSFLLFRVRKTSELEQQQRITTAHKVA